MVQSPFDDLGESLLNNLNQQFSNIEENYDNSVVICGCLHVNSILKFAEAMFCGLSFLLMWSLFSVVSILLLILAQVSLHHKDNAWFDVAIQLSVAVYTYVCVSVLLRKGVDLWQARTKRESHTNVTVNTTFRPLGLWIVGSGIHIGFNQFVAFHFLLRDRGGLFRSDSGYWGYTFLFFLLAMLCHMAGYVLEHGYFSSAPPPPSET